MNLIEQAARRLEELRRAGADLPEKGNDSPDEGRSPASLAFQASDSPSGQPAGIGSSGEARASAPPVGRQGRSAQVELDFVHLAAAGFVTPDAPGSRIADEFRVIKRPLIANAFGRTAAKVRNGNLIMVTSAVPGEGKSFCAVNLAISMAMELDRSVLLVDADVARPSLPGLLGLASAQGLLDLLVDESMDLSQVLLRTNMNKLSLLPCGTQHPRATELLASTDMARLLSEMAGRYPDRVIIFDSPPLLITTEARALATHMGQIVCVVRAESTLQSQVKEALDTIEACPLKMILLNQATTPGQGAYGYGYGYRP